MAGNQENRRATNSMNKKFKGFTLVELIIVIAIIGILSAILIPSIAASYSRAKEDIVEIYNSEKHVVCYYRGNVIYEGPAKSIPEDFKTKYKLVDIEYHGNFIYLYYEDADIEN